MARTRDNLANDTIIDNYRIEKTFSKGGFSLVYLGADEDTGDEVVIKEYLPKRIARRDENMNVVPNSEKHRENFQRGLKLFFQEAKALSSLRHPNIVHVTGFFRAHNTAYLVTQYERGRNLGSYVQERGGGLSTTFIHRVFIPVLEALATMHSKDMLHLDVKPGNIHLRHGHDPLLLDLGAVHLMAHGRSSGGQVITAGYSPPEQYYSGGKVGPWTDVYAVGASIRTCLEGKTPQPSVDRAKNDAVVPARKRFADRYPKYLLAATDWAMQMPPEKRPQDAGQLLDLLNKYGGDLPDLPKTNEPFELSLPTKRSTPSIGFRDD